MALSLAAQRIADTYQNLSVAELINVQAVHVSDYYRFKAEGCTEAMERVLGVVNAFGEYIDLRDGTTRP